MRKQRWALGTAVLFAMTLSAFAASSASASSAFTCVKGAGELIGAHCLPGSTGEYGHVAVEPGTQTTGTVTNANTAEETKAARSTTIKGSLAGLSTEITCADVHGEGIFENVNMEGQLHFTRCEVKVPAGKGCKVAGETIMTYQLTGSTEGDAMKFEPKEPGGKFAEIKIESCSVAALNNTFPVTGTAKSAASTGATLTVTHAEVTTQNTLKFAGSKAGIEGALTFKGHSKAGEETKPLAFTTTP